MYSTVGLSVGLSGSVAENPYGTVSSFKISSLGFLKVTVNDSPPSNPTTSYSVDVKSDLVIVWVLLSSSPLTSYASEFLLLWISVESSTVISVPSYL